MHRGGTCLLVLCGIPGCGKTSLSNNLLDHVSRIPGCEVSLVCFDEYVAPKSDEAVAADFSPESWKEGREAALQATERLLRAGMREQGPLYRLVIVDDTMHYKSMRHQCYRLASQSGAVYIELYLRCPVEVAQQRNQLRPAAQQIPAEVVSHTADIFEEPGRSPAAQREQPTLTVEGTAPIDVAQLWDRIWEAWGRAPPQRPDAQELAWQVMEARRLTSESLLHQLELACRRQVASCMCQVAGLPPQQRATLARRLNECKRGLLGAARDGQMAEPSARLGTGSCGGVAEGSTEGWSSRSPHAGDVAAAGLDVFAAGMCSWHVEQDLGVALAYWVGKFKLQCEAAVLAVQGRANGTAALEPG